MSSSPEPVTVTLQSRKDSANKIKLRIVRWGAFPGLPRQAQCKHRIWVRGRRATVLEMGGYEQRARWCTVQTDGGAYQPGKEAGRGNDMDSSPEPPGRCSPTDTLISAQADPVQTCDLQCLR